MNDCAVVFTWHLSFPKLFTFCKKSHTGWWDGSAGVQHKPGSQFYQVVLWCHIQIRAPVCMCSLSFKKKNFITYKPTCLNDRHHHTGLSTCTLSTTVKPHLTVKWMLCNLFQALGYYLLILTASPFLSFIHFFSQFLIKLSHKYKKIVTITQFLRNALTQRAPCTLFQWEKEEDIIINLLQERQVKPTFPAKQRTNSRVSEAQKEKYSRMLTFLYHWFGFLERTIREAEN